MVEDREEMPQRDGRDPCDQFIRGLIVPEPRCTSHARGLCRCTDDGYAAPENDPSDDVVKRALDS